MNVVGIVIALILAYLIGSVSGALVLGRAFGVSDLRTHGSGNAGATNAWRIGGAGFGLAVLLFDLVKGAVAAGFVAAFLAPVLPWPYVCGFLAVAGHVWPVFHGFRGGKGVATAAGVMAILLPAALVAALAVFLLVAWRLRYVSLAALAGQGVATLLLFVWPGPGPAAPGLSLALLLLLVHTHRANIDRLRAGTEPRIGVSRPGSKD